MFFLAIASILFYACEEEDGGTDTSKESTWTKYFGKSLGVEYWHSFVDHDDNLLISSSWLEARLESDLDYGSDSIIRRTLLMKINPSGQLLWEKVIDTLGRIYFGYETDDHNYNLYALEYRYEIVNEDHLNRIFEPYLYKLDNNGNFLSKKKLDSRLLGWFNGISKTSEDGMLMTNARLDTSFLYNVDRNGNIIWQTINSDIGFQTIEENSFGDIIWAGEDVDHNNAWVKQIGTYEWFKCVCDAEGSLYDMCVQSDNSIVLQYAIKSAGLKIICISYSGDKMWETMLDNYWGYLHQNICPTNDGGVAFVIRTTGSYKLIKVTSDGKIDWETKIANDNWPNGGDFPYRVNELSNGGFYVSGSYIDKSDRHDHEVLVIKVNSNGKLDNPNF